MCRTACGWKSKKQNKTMRSWSRESIYSMATCLVNKKQRTTVYAQQSWKIALYFDKIEVELYSSLVCLLTLEVQIVVKSINFYCLLSVLKLWRTLLIPKIFRVKFFEWSLAVNRACLKHESKNLRWILRRSLRCTFLVYTVTSTVFI